MNDTTRAIPRALIAYHEDCIDGYTSAWVTCLAMVRKDYEADTMSITYNLAGDVKLIRRLASSHYDMLYVVDFSLSIEVLEQLALLHPELKITILDHHKTAFEKYAPGICPIVTESYLDDIRHGAHIVLANNRSGASLCWEFFGGLPEFAGKLVRYVQDYDIWQFKYGLETKWVNKYLMSQEQNLGNWSRIAEELDGCITRDGILAKGLKLQTAHDKRVMEVAARAVGITISGEKGLVVECPIELKDDVGDVLAAECGTYGAIYQIHATKNQTKWSLRSVGDFSVNAIAVKHGGGGHKNAAGFYKELFSELPQEID